MSEYNPPNQRQTVYQKMSEENQNSRTLRFLEEKKKT